MTELQPNEQTSTYEQIRDSAPTEARTNWQSADWNYPDVADKFRLCHRNLLHCSLLILSRAEVA